MEQKQTSARQPEASRTTAVRPAAPKPAAAAKTAAPKPAAVKPGPAKPAAAKPAAAKPASAKPATGKPAAGKPTVSKPAAAKTPSGKPASAKPSSAKPAARKGKSKRLARRRKRLIRRLSILAGCIALLLIAFFMTASVVDGKIYLRSTEQIDLRNRGLTGVRSVSRLTSLNEALLSGNGITDASPLASLTGCEFIDLTGNPVSDESYAKLREALPDCLILCEAADHTTTSLALGGYPLPGLSALERVFASHSALTTVDLRGTRLTPSDADSLRSRFPAISFLYSGSNAADTTMLSLSGAAEAAEALASLPGAAHVTITDCTFTAEEYRALKAQFPATTIDCAVSLYGKTQLSTSSVIDLSGTLPDASLEENLRLFPSMKTLTLPETLPSEAARLKEAFGLDSVRYTYNGCLIAPGVTSVDLKGAPSLNAAELSLLMDSLPQAETVVMDAPDDEMLPVIRACKDRVRFLYEVTAFGKTYSTTQEIIDFGGSIEDDDVDELMALLDRLPALKEAHMYESTLSQESMDKLFDAYPDVFFGWTFKMCKGKYVVRTDITAFCTQLGAPLHEFTQVHLGQLRYCKKLEALDLCHNAITDLEFISNLPHLKLLIIGDNQLTDISPLAKLKELEYLEIFMNYDLTDFSPLSGLPLTDLNIRNPKGKRNQITADPFLGITTLERFWASAGHFNDTEAKRLRAALPDCVVCVTLDHSTGDDWRGDGRQEVIERMFDTRIYEPLP